MSTYFTIRRLTDGRSDGTFEEVSHDDPDVQQAVIYWHLSQAQRRGQTIEIVPGDVIL